MSACSDFAPHHDLSGLLAELKALAVETAPRRFTICELYPEDANAAIVRWGLAFPDEVVVYLPCFDPLDSFRFTRFPSVDAARRRLARREGVRLVWIDAEPDAK